MRELQSSRDRRRDMSDHDTEQEQQAPPGEEQSSESGERPSEEQQKARKSEEVADQAEETMQEIEKDPPEKLEDWPDDMAKYKTFGGPEGTHSYQEGPEAQLGPSSLRHHEGGKVTVEGEEVDDPEQYKGDPVPGGPTDPDAPSGLGDKDASGGPEKEQDSDEG
jgi:hypothetical protein